VLQALQSDPDLVRVEIVYDKLGVGTLFFIPKEGPKVPSYEYQPKVGQQSKTVEKRVSNPQQGVKEVPQDPKDLEVPQPIPSKKAKVKGPSETPGLTLEEWMQFDPKDQIAHWADSVRPNGFQTSWNNRLGRLDPILDRIPNFPDLSLLRGVDDVRDALSAFLNSHPEEARLVCHLLFCTQRLVPPVRRALVNF